MLFTSSFKLLSVAAFFVPTLLVSASPHSLSERTEPGTIRHLKLNECLPADSTADCRVFDDVVLKFEFAENDVDVFRVEGGWDGAPAIAKATERLGAWIQLKQEKDVIVAGNDGGERLEGKRTHYVIFKSEENEDSDESDDTIKAA